MYVATAICCLVKCYIVEMLIVAILLYVPYVLVRSTLAHGFRLCSAGKLKALLLLVRERRKFVGVDVKHLTPFGFLVV